MRSISILALGCIAVLSCPATADEVVRPNPHDYNRLAVQTVSTDIASWMAGAESSRSGRLSYLQASRCDTPGACSGGGSVLDVTEPDYIKSLTLGSYGPMDVKFTGDRVKLKVKF